VHNALWDALPLFKAEGIESGLFTNGSLLNEERCEIIVETCVFVRFSLDAHDQETHTRIHRPKKPDFDKIVRNIWLLTSLREETGSSIKIGVSYLVCPENYQGIVEGAKLMKRIGVDYFQLKPVVMFSGPQLPPEFFRETARPYIERAVELADETFKVYSLNYKFGDMAKGGDYNRTYRKCWGHPFRAVIGSDSNVYICCHLKGIPKFSFGNLKEKSWQEIWNGAQRQEAISRIDIRKCQPLCTAHEMNKILEDLSRFEDPSQRIDEILGSERDAARDAFL
jgi:sulfatase maturation enzyme AslB (radical SAM superfamily)